jgi:hypothetical protein
MNSERRTNSTLRNLRLRAKTKQANYSCGSGTRLVEVTTEFGY